MYSTDLLLKVPKTILLTGISGIDGKPISAIAWKALLSIMYFSPNAITVKSLCRSRSCT